MNKVIFLALIFLIFNIHAGRLRLKNGDLIDVPDKLIIYNDDEDIVFVETGVEFPAQCSEARRPQGFHLAKNQEREIEVNQTVSPQHSTDLLGICVKGRKYQLYYPTNFHPDALDGKPLEVLVRFRYKISDIMKEKVDQKGLTVQDEHK